MTRSCWGRLLPEPPAIVWLLTYGRFLLSTPLLPICILREEEDIRWSDVQRTHIDSIAVNNRRRFILLFGPSTGPVSTNETVYNGRFGWSEPGDQL